MNRWGTHRDAAPPAIRRAVLQRDGHQCTYVESGTRCTTPATDVHHVIEHSRGGTDDESNLVSLCAWHHRRITAKQAHAARWTAQRKRQPPPHPGLKA